MLVTCYFGTILYVGYYYHHAQQTRKLKLSNDKDTKRITFGLVGAGGFGREVMPLEKSNLPGLFQDENVNITFVDLQSTPLEVNSVQLMDENTFVSLVAKEKYFNVAIADSKVREQVVNRIVDSGATPLAIPARVLSYLITIQ